jgi:carbon monoxide dehydrogenase subunit G
MSSHTVNVSIGRPPEDVAQFVSNPENLPVWAHGLCKAVGKSGNDWIAETAQGPMKVRFAPKNEFGVLDHYLTDAHGVEITVPMRVLANGTGSELIFTIFRPPGMSDLQLAHDIGLVQQDFKRLKELLEHA